MALKTSVITIKVNGKSVDCLPGCSIKLGGKTRTPLVVNGVAGTHYTEVDEPGGATLKIAHGADTDIAEIAAWTDVTLVAYTNSGKVYQMAGAYVVNNPELSDGDSALSIEFAGPRFVEL